MRRCLLMLCLFMPLLLFGVHAAASEPVPLSYFKLPSTVTGPSHPFTIGGEGGGPGTVLPPADTYEPSQTPAVVAGYMFAVIPNISASSNSVQGYYEITIYRTVRAAMAANAGYRDSAYDPQSQQPFAPITVDSPLNSNEWLRGRHAINNPSQLLCETSGGVRYQNVRVDTFILDLDSRSAAGSVPCAGENGWSARVMAALYPRLVAFAATHPPLGLPAAAPVVRIVEPFDAYGRLLSGYNSPAGASPPGAAPISCTAGSLVSGRADAYRCMAGPEIHDPCFAPHVPRPKVVACVTDPRIRYASVFNLGGPLPAPFASATPAGQGQPWAVDLATAEQCSFLQGATTSVGDLRANYGCGPDGTIYGNINRSGRQWTALLWRGLPSEKPSQGQLERVGITVAYF